MTAFVEELARVAGTASVQRGPVAGVEPLAWVRPRSAEQVAAVLALCSTEGVPVEPAGAGTWLAAGRPPQRQPVVVSTAALDAVVEHEPADLVVGVQAGMPLTMLQQHLAGVGQMLGLDPAGRENATIGATLSLGAAGSVRAAHGTPRDVILGVEVATGDGRLLRFGGRVVKNVAGYDAVRLMVGSRGSLGIITSAFLLLRSIPEADATFLVEAGDPTAAVELATEIGRTVPCEALELLSPSLAAEVAGGAAGGATGAAPGDAASGAARRGAGAAAAGWLAAVRIRSGAAALADAETRLRAVASPSRVRTLDEAGGRSLWVRLGAAEAAPIVYSRIAAGQASLGRSLLSALAVSQRMSASDNELDGHGGWRIAAHATAGIVRMWGPEPRNAAAADVASDVLQDLRREISAHGGTVHFPVLPAALHDRIEAYQAPAEPALRLMREVKRVFDPAGIMSPARHVL